VVELPLSTSQAGHDIPEALSETELAERQGQKLIPASQRAHSVVARVTLNTLLEVVPGNQVHQLGEDGLA